MARIDTHGAARSESLSALAPLKHPVFRMLWIGWLVANVCMWMNDVAAAWLMHDLSSAPLMVALVQSASALPVFLLGLPSGALADILDRRRYFIATQFWIAAVAGALCVVTLTDSLSAPVLLALTFANGIGLAMRMPVFAALVPELVPRSELPRAMALNGVAMNSARIVGPMVAGAVIATAGSAYVFVLNALLSIAVGTALLRWRREVAASELPNERFFGAIRVGVQYVAQSPVMHAVLLRVFTFFFFSIVQLALMPVIATRLLSGAASTYTLLVASIGVGAIAGALLLPRLRKRFSRDQLVSQATLMHALTTLVLVVAPNAWVAVPAMLLAGHAWISAANSLAVAAQMALPDWVKARGMAIYQMAMLGGAALGSALWGQVATTIDVRAALIASAAASLLALLATHRFRVGSRSDEEHTPARLWAEPEVAFPIEHDRGPVLVTIEYRIDAARTDEFVGLMRESRRARLRNGAIAWGLFRNTAEPGKFIEYFIDESWVEHMRQHARVTVSDLVVREQMAAFHLGDSPPIVSHYVAQPLNEPKRQPASSPASQTGDEPPNASAK